MKNKFCQSCGIPLKQDPNHGGTNKKGSKNELYCSFCYKKGTFTNPQIDTAKKMQDFCIKKMKEQGVPSFLGWIFTRSIPKLNRWKS